MTLVKTTRGTWHIVDGDKTLCGRVVRRRLSVEVDQARPGGPFTFARLCTACQRRSVITLRPEGLEIRRLR